VPEVDGNVQGGDEACFLEGKEPSSVVINGNDMRSRRCVPLLIIFTLYVPIPTLETCRELIKRGRQPINGTIWGNGVPSLSNGVYAASPPLVVVGGITFYRTRSVRGSNLSASRRPYSCY